MLACKTEEVFALWPSIADIFSVPQTEADYEKLVALLDDIAAEVKEDECHPLASLMDTIGTLVESYERENYPEPEVHPSEILNFLMNEHQLRNNDLPEIGSEEIVSNIISGSIDLDAPQIKYLSKRFNTSSRVFLNGQ